MAYDQAAHAAVLFGGTAGGAPLGDTWTWDGAHWLERSGLTASPSARLGAAMAYDDQTQQVILFGGQGPSGDGLDDTWAWDGSAWHQLQPSHRPSAREGASAVYDPALSEVILFGGMNDTTAKPSPIDDTWAWNGLDWTQLKPVQSPTGGVRPRLAFLAGANLVERFGDCIESHDNRLYWFDGHSWTGASPTGSWPGALCLPSLGGDPTRQQLILFGGNPGTGQTPLAADTWIYNGSGWAKATPAQSPPARYDAPMVYDTDHHLLVLFGGQGLNQGQTGPLNDTWTWDGANWTAHQ